MNTVLKPHLASVDITYDSFLALANALGVNNYVIIIEGTVPLLEGDGKSMNSYYH